MESILITIWLLCGLFGALMGESKNRKLDGLLLGLILGIFGLIILVFLPEKEHGKSSFSLDGVIVIAAVIGGIAALFFYMRKDAVPAPAAEATVAPITVAPIAATSIPRPPTTPSATPDPRAVAAEIARKYAPR